MPQLRKAVLTGCLLLLGFYRISLRGTGAWLRPTFSVWPSKEHRDHWEPVGTP
jgi:hypothetical protein